MSDARERERERESDPARPGPATTTVDREAVDPAAPSTTAAATDTTCALCEQRIAAHEALTIVFDGRARDRTVCRFCARSLFDVETGTDTATVTGPVTGPDTDAGTTPTRAAAHTRRDDGSAAAVTWSPDRAANRSRSRPSGITGTLLAMHRLSLSFLWAVHRTNVRLFERLFDETDVQLLVTLGLVLATVATVAVAAVAV